MKHIAEQFELPGIPPSAQLCLLKPYAFVRGCGDIITLGVCPVCGRNVTRSRANRRGGKCVYDGSQFDAAGFLVWCPASRDTISVGRTGTTQNI